ncbi:MAG TPA: 50S ribosomal protein L32 [Fimbriimonadaceae bacterium]|nr:50S ribosomal protein L32 [Fimbriimonadaceae bacterium]HRJ33139.1 50S ribosomal protein L32 [Fimbriimonadaceae bacterium]
MPNPKRRHSHARTAKRRTHYVTEMPEVSLNRQQGTSFPLHKRHNASPDGYYKGRRLPGYKD